MHLKIEFIIKMKNKGLKNTISNMVKEKEKNSLKEDLNKKESFDISYEDGIKYFGSMMERILSSIEKIESNFDKMRDQN